MKLTARLSAVKIVDHVLKGHATHSAEEFLASLNTQERAFALQLSQGTLSQLPFLTGIVRQLLQTRLKAKEQIVEAILLVGLYQLSHLRTPDHAAVHESVQLAKVLKKMWAVKLLNACLRRFIREQQALVAQLKPYEAAAHPGWLFAEIQSQWRDRSAEIIAANNRVGPLCLRVNRQKTDRPSYSKKLEKEGIKHGFGALSEDCIRLTNPTPVASLPGFQEGLVSVQDEAAQLASTLMDAQRATHVLDACAAPGGKSCHLKERYPHIDLTSRDIDIKRLGKVRENADRLGLSFTIEAAPDTPGDVKYDFILADAPCSGSGVIRRHPDIKALRTREDLMQFHEQQLKILRNLWMELKPGGQLLYVTCSIFDQENDDTIASFCNTEPSARSDVLQVNWGEATRFGRQLLPQVDGTDGLYYAKLSKAE